MSPTTRSHHTRRSGQTGPTSPAETLGVLVDVLDQSLPEDAGPMAFLLRGRRLGSADSKLQAISANDLFAWRAPADVQAIGVVGSGTPHPLDGTPHPLDGTPHPLDGTPHPLDGTPPAPDDAPPAAGDPTTTCGDGPGDRLRAAAAAGGPPVRVVIAMDRRGAVRGRITVEGMAEDEPPAGGRLHDTIRRCFGLPTAPPTVSPGHLVATLWLAAVVDVAAGGGPLGWPEVRALHPAVRTLTAHVTAPSDCEMRAAIRMAPLAWDWEQLRVQDATTGNLEQLCPSELARWMDSGMFSRWVVEGMTPLPPLLDAVRVLVSPDAVAGIEAVLGDESY